MPRRERLKQQQEQGRKDSKEGERQQGHKFGTTTQLATKDDPLPLLLPQPKGHTTRPASGGSRTAGSSEDAARCLPPAQASESGPAAGAQSSDSDTGLSGTL